MDFVGGRRSRARVRRQRPLHHQHHSDLQLLHRCQHPIRRRLNFFLRGALPRALPIRGANPLPLDHLRHRRLHLYLRLRVDNIKRLTAPVIQRKQPEMRDVGLDVHDDASELREADRVIQEVERLVGVRGS